MSTDYQVLSACGLSRRKSERTYNTVNGPHLINSCQLNRAIPGIQMRNIYRALCIHTSGHDRSTLGTATIC
jgi:hypothetical protein